MTAGRFVTSLLVTVVHANGEDLWPKEASAVFSRMRARSSRLVAEGLKLALSRSVITIQTETVSAPYGTTLVEERV